MDKKEFATFAMALRTYYPREQLLPNQQAMELWYRELNDIPYDVAEAGLRKWVVNNKWSPSIADIREMTATVTLGDIPDWSKAWEQVTNAIRAYGYYRVKETLDSLDELPRECVKRMGGVRELCMSENAMADRANFRMIYEQLAARKRQDMSMPAQLKDAIKGMLEKQEQLRIGGSNDESKRIPGTGRKD